LPDSYFVDFVPTVERLTTDDITNALARHLDASRLTTVVVGDYEATSAALAGLGLGDPVVLSSEAF
ncbi:MAG: hypothetical protein ABUS56_07525, partial [Acidobacteriota bacterium]